MDTLLWVLRAIAGGALSYLAQRLLANAQQRYKQLSSRSLGSTDQDKEELLRHFLDEVEDVEALDVIGAIHVIRLRTEVSTTYVFMWVQKLSADKGKPGGV